VVSNGEKLGEQPDWDDLLAHALPGLRALVRARMSRRLRGLESASDISQSVCREVIDDLRRAGREGLDADELQRWLKLAVERKLADRHRRALRSKRGAGVEPVSLDETRSACEPRAPTRNGGRPSAGVQVREDLARVAQHLDRLPHDYREVILLAHRDGLDRAAIARRLGRTPHAVRTLLYRAMARLAQLMDEA
jgi:RNA polymerase sigma factor (sigma-70 family)